ncbi:lanthionine synthetase [Ktedonobacter sp. SOSP1-52]|uniref:type 2 lanthipeptide synthetase LanM family protein n=1 Tax=Ktedonobacter sp. SOSP1-52 TaxID=2778366 RepID=UPI0019165811|nr:type 2 lanthipeptide synthetase LanM family protein [Ktedonobacter sp. SOSP1-52]GHO67240.1 lanthionine synthetase [Ktedonobacter sp. SOSP1-52]
MSIKEVNAFSSTTTLEKQSYTQVSANWYRALTLVERAALFSRANTASPFPVQEVSEAAKRRLARWKEQRPFKDEHYFAQRLAKVGLTDEEFQQVLSASPESLKERAGSVPEWLQILLSVFQDEQAPEEAVLKLLEQNQATSRSFISTLQPLLVYTWRRLNEGVERIAEKYAVLPFEREQIVASLFSLLPNFLLNKSGRTFILELNVARVEGRLQGETPAERFQSFLQQLSSKQNILAFLEEYAVLARLLVEGIESWLEVHLEILERLCRDWKEIRATFCPDLDPGMLIEIQGGQGDTHRGGQSVAILQWSSGFRLVYKPRSLSTDVHFQELLLWLNEHGFQPAFRPFTLLNREKYGWVEFIPNAPCQSKDELERFYQRQGGFLALLYALQAADFHAENLIASGEHPFLIDLEVLFLPLARDPAQPEDSQEAPGIEGPPRTVLNIGLLPSRIWSGENSDGVDISAVGGRPGQLSPAPVPTLQGDGTDEMSIKRERIEMALGQNLPTLQGQFVDPFDYAECIVTGFTNVYRLLLTQREDLLTRMIPRFAQDEVRCLVRHTQLYGTLLEHSYHPNVLRDALDRDRLFDRLWFNVDALPPLLSVINSEAADMWAGDIPFFYSRASTRDLMSYRGERIPNFFVESGLDLVRREISRLNERDLALQSWLIRSSFIYLVKGSDRSLYPSLQLDPTPKPFSREGALEGALAVGERLHELMLENGDFVDWMGVSIFDQESWGLGPAGADLYAGNAGIIFFLAYLGALTGREKYSTIARRALKMLRGQVEFHRKVVGVFNIGVYNGLSSYVYLLSHLGMLWNEPALFSEAEECVRAIVEQVPTDEMLDVVAGSASAIAAFLSLYRIHPSQTTLDAAIACGEHLLAKKVQLEVGIGWITKTEDAPLAGLGHGSAGIALDLLRLADISGDERFREAALQAFAFERHVFSPEHNNWPDLRAASAEDEGKKYIMAAWCHGAAGIALARLGCLRYIDDEAIRAEIEAGLKATMMRGFGNSHSLCHGDMASLDTLLTAALVLNDPQYQEKVEHAAPILLESIQRQGWVSGAPMGMETTGLMLGITGAGYTWLRLAFPNMMPSVLLLDPPIQNN